MPVFMAGTLILTFILYNLQHTDNDQSHNLKLSVIQEMEQWLSDKRHIYLEAIRNTPNITVQVLSTPGV